MLHNYKILNITLHCLHVNNNKCKSFIKRVVKFLPSGAEDISNPPSAWITVDQQGLTNVIIGIVLNHILPDLSNCTVTLVLHLSKCQIECKKDNCLKLLLHNLNHAVRNH